MKKLNKKRIYKISEHKDSNIVYIEAENMKKALIIWEKIQKISKFNEPYSCEYATEKIFFD